MHITGSLDYVTTVFTQKKIVFFIVLIFVTVNGT